MRDFIEDNVISLLYLCCISCAVILFFYMFNKKDELKELEIEKTKLTIELLKVELTEREERQPTRQSNNTPK